MKHLKKELERSIEIQDPLKRRLHVLSVITHAVEPFGVQPVLIGGGAVEYYTFGGYSTMDIDLAVPVSKKFDTVMKQLGFKKQGRHWFRDDLGIFIEGPTSDLRAQGEMAPYTEVSTAKGYKCYIIGIEDLIIDRLNGFVHWKWMDDGRWVKELINLHGKKLNWKYIYQKAKEDKTYPQLLKLKKEANK